MTTLRVTLPGAIFLLSALSMGLAGCDGLSPKGEWDNPRDPQGINYNPPVVVLRDTVLRDGERGVVRAAISSRVSTIAEVRWTVDGGLQSSRDSALPTAGWAPGSHRVSVRAVDALGIGSPEVSANVWIGNLPPVLAPQGVVRQEWSAATLLSLAATDPDGAAPEISWDTVPGRFAIRSEQVQLDALPEGGWRMVFWRAIDADGAETRSSFEVRHLPEIRISVQPDIFHPDVTGATGGGGSWSVSLQSGKTLPLLVDAAIPGFSDEPLVVTFAGVACASVDPANPFYRFGAYRCATGERRSGNYEVVAQDGLGRRMAGRVYISVR